MFFDRVFIGDTVGIFVYLSPFVSFQPPDRPLAEGDVFFYKRVSGQIGDLYPGYTSALVGGHRPY